MLPILLLTLVAVLFTAIAAGVFTGLTLMLGKAFPEFEIQCDQEWTIQDLYLRYLIVAAAFTVVALPLTLIVGILGWVLGMGALLVAYKHTFDIPWPQASLIGLVGGAVAASLFLMVLQVIILPLKLFAG